MSASDGPQLGVPPAAAQPRPAPNRTSIAQARHLSRLASGGSIALMVGGVATVGLSLLPLRITDSQWQLGMISNLLANGPWILLGLVLLHLASLFQPLNGPLRGRLLNGRRLASAAALLYLLITPLPLVLTWNNLHIDHVRREQVIVTSSKQMRDYREALTLATNLADLRIRMGAIRGAAPLPPDVNSAPFGLVRREMLRQLEGAEERFRGKVLALRADPNRWELWRKALQGSVASLMLALGFASGAEGWSSPGSAMASLLKGKKRPTGEGTRIGSLKTLRSRLSLKALPRRWTKATQGLQRRLSRLSLPLLGPLRRKRGKAKRPALGRPWPWSRASKPKAKGKSGSSSTRVRISR